MIHLPKPLAPLALALFPAIGGAHVLQNAAAAQQKGPDLEELAKQASAALHAISTVPVTKAAWPSFTVNGVPVNSEEVERVNIYFAGDAAMLATKISVAVDKEHERLKKEGKNQDRLAIGNEEFQKRLTELRKRVELAFPDKSFEQWLAEQRQTPVSLEYSLKTQFDFDSTFLPLGQAWPDITVNAVRTLRPGLDSKQQDDFLQQLILANKNQGGQNRADAFAMILLRQQIIKQLVDPLPMKDELDGLPPDVVIEVDGRPFKTRDLYERGMGLGAYLDSLKAMQFAIVREAVKQAIVRREDEDWARAKAAGNADAPRPVYWLKEGSEEFAKAFAAEKASYPPGPFDHRGIVRFRRFPTMQLYRMYFQMIESYRRMTAAERTDKVIEKHVADHSLYFTGGQAEVEVIWYSYSSDPSVRAVEDGFASARARAEKALADLRKGGELAAAAMEEAKKKGATDEEASRAGAEAARGLTFSDILDRDSDYRDPKPNPNQPQVPQALNNRGRFGPLQRNPLTEKMFESELTHLLNGYSFSEDLFFRAPIGEVVGPVRCTNGYFLARVVSRTPGTKVTNLAEKQQMELAQQDYVNHAFQIFVNSAMEKAKVALAQ
jgi:hypothetical protein